MNLTVLVAALFGALGEKAAAQPSGLVAAYAFDEGTGTTIADASGNGNGGTIGEATWTTSGQYGSALAFNGTSALVTILDSASLHLATGMTLEAWVSPTAVGGWRDVVYKGPDDSYYLMGSSDNSTPALGGTFAPSAVRGTASLTLNTWTHLAGTYDGATMRLYVNGVQVGSRAQTGSIATSTGALTIGGDALYGQYFAGRIDEVRVYNRALSVTEIQTDMNTPIGNPPPTGLSIDPPVAALTFTRTQPFTSNKSNGVWMVDGVIGGSASSGTITTAGLYSPPSAIGVHTVTVKTSDPSQSASATVYIVNHPGVFTHHLDNLRTGANLNETVLTPANVTAATFGKLFTYPIDGLSFASPLYVANVNIPGQGFHNVVYVATEHDSVYAFDADGLASSPLWQVSFLKSGVTTVPCADVGECGDIPNEIGITGTPVIDPATGTLYVVAKTKEGVNYVQRLHALDIATGSEKFGGPVVLQASVPGTGTGSQGGQLPFLALRENQRPALLLNNGVIYIAFASHGDVQPYHGWVLAYDASTLQQTFAFCVTPNNEGAGIWQSGGGLAADAAGSVYFASGDGTFTADVGGIDYGDSFVKLSPTGTVQDYFTPYDESTLDRLNLDLCAGGVLLLPDQPGSHPHLLIGSGKNATVYLVDRDNMGHFHANNNSHAVQTLPNIFPNGTPEPGNYINPVYFNGTLFFCPVADNIQAFSLSNGLLSTAPTSRSSEVYTMPGGTLAISANGTNNGILWAMQRNGTTDPGVLYAYDPADLGTVLYNSDQAGGRDTLDVAAKYTMPLVVNGKVFVVTLSGLTAYGGISAGTPLAPAPPVLATPTNGATGVVTAPTLTWNASTGATSYRLQVSTDSGFASPVVDQSNITTTTYAASGLAGNTLFYWRVSASNSGGTSAFSTAFSFTTTAPPLPPPAPVLATPADGATEVVTSPTLAWNAATGATSYHLQVSTDAGFATPVVDQSNITTTFYAATGLAGNTLFYWRLSASNGGGTSAYSAAWSFTTVTLPDGAALYGQYCASCHGPLATSTKHDRTAAQIQAAIDSNRGGVMGSPELRALTPIQVEAIAAALVTPPAAPVLASPANGAAGVSANPALTWDAAPRATSYRVQVSTDTGFAALVVDQSSITTTSAAVSGLLTNTLYYWHVNASNSGGTSAYSAAWSFTTAAPPPPPAPPGLATPANGATGVAANPTLTWNASAGATSYRLQVSTSSVFTTTVVDQGGITTTSWPISGLATNTTYYWHVNAANSGGTSAYSTPWNFATVAIQGGPVAAYAFDDGTGTTVGDASGNGNQGTISGAAWTSSGRYGKALVFDGTNALVTIDDAASLHLTTAMTLEAWVNPRDVSGGWRDVIYKGDDNYFLEATTTSGGSPAGGGTFGGVNMYTAGDTMLATNAWSHLAVTYDGATLRLYVNGVLVSSLPQAGNIRTSTNPLQIGGDDIYGQYFQGTIDEVRVYNRALTASQIQADMNTPLGVPMVAASAAPTSGLVPLTVAFSSAGSSDPDGGLLSYAWNFGDGSPWSTAANPTHSYQTAGVFAAQLTVSDGVNFATSSVVRITVGTPGETPPSVRLSGARYFAAENSEIATINVWLSKPYYLDVFADFAAAGGTATPGVDYVTNRGTLRFLPGETNRSFLVTLLDTSSQNAAERTVHLTLSDFSGGTAGDPVAGDLVILDDDSPPRFEASRLSSEGLFQTTLLGLPGQRFSIETSLTSTQWTGLTTLTNLTGIMDFTDATSLGAPQRYYRTVTGYRGVFTHHNDNSRTGQNLSETILTTSNVTAASFGKLFAYPLDGITFSSPLYAAGVNIPGLGFRNVVYVATEHDSVYAFDADGLAAGALWQVSFINPAAGVTTVPAIETGETQDIPNEIGITGTPVIDPATGTLYVVAKTKEVIGGSSDYVQRLHALDLATGAEKFGGPVVIQAGVPGTGEGSDNGQLPFDALRENQRPALLLSRGVVYIGFASHGDQQPYHGWVLGYHATTLQQVMAYCVTPDGEGGGIWQGGGGLAADAAGNIYFISGDGTFDADSGGANYGDSFVKISPGGAVLDYFTPYDQADLDAANLDLGSANPLLLPDQPGPHPHLVTSVSKNGGLYLVDRDSMGHFNPADNSQIVQSIGVPHENYISPVCFNGKVYYSLASAEIRAYQLTNGRFSESPTSQSADTYAFPGGALAISANGASQGILWAVERRGTALSGVLHAYDANDLGVELYNSNQAGSRDTLDIAAKYSVPLVVNGRVYVASISQLTAYGLLR